MKKILVSGANGQLGKSFQKIVFDWQEYDFHFCEKDELDISNKNSIEEVFDKYQPDVFINCAAYTAVDQAENEREKAYAINGEALDFITASCKKHDALLIHYSSDYVYDNGMDVPMSEDSMLSPKSIYAQSKRMGEEVIEHSNVDAIIIRTSWVYSEFGHNFLKTMLNLGKVKSMLNIVEDQIGAPTYAGDIANATMKILRHIESNSHKGCQVLNYCGEGTISWFDFAEYIFEEANIDVKIHPIPSADYPTPAMRPSWSVLDMTKIKSIYGIAPKYWKESVKECIYLLS